MMMLIGSFVCPSLEAISFLTLQAADKRNIGLAWTEEEAQMRFNALLLRKAAKRKWGEMGAR